MVRKVDFPTISVTLSLSFLLTINAGCMLDRQSAAVPVASQPAAEAPRVQLRFASKPTLSLVSHQLTPRVVVVDARVPEEKRYYPGETESTRNADAIAILPLESFQPAFDKALKEKVIGGLTDAVDYELIEIRLKSFHVALDERRSEQPDEQASAASEESEAPPSAATSLQRIAAPVQTAVAAITDRIPGAASRRESTSQSTLPDLLVRSKQAGWNCVLHVDVVAIDRNGEQRTLPVQTAVHEPDDRSLDTNRQVQNVVTLALDEFAKQLAQTDREVAQTEPAGD